MNQVSANTSAQGAPTANIMTGGMADLQPSAVLLPAFVERRAAGLFVDVAQATRAGGLIPFVERVFAAGARFVGLDYTLFLNLLYNLTEPPLMPVRLADAIVPFAPERRMLYRTVKIAPDNNSVEYMFEPVEIEIEEQALVFSPPGADGATEVIGQEMQRRSAPTQLDFDEFVAAMWEKDVRFGINAAQVRAVIQSRQTARLAIAHTLPATPGRDATLEEKTKALHRDNAPKILSDGRADLSSFKNRFPQITGGERLLQKIPRIFGKPGRNVLGAVLEPEIPKDFELAALAGPGTSVVKGADGELIVAALDGFLTIDSKSNQVSVTDKIISHEGVSMKTTGDVALTGDEFEEHGEVQDRRSVEGRHMTFFADVYGNITSSGGRVVFKANLAGGQASSPGGSITVEGRASRSVLEARGGDIHIAYAEGCSIVGSRITVNQAVNCDILGEEVTIGVSEGSAIAGRRVKIAQSTTRKDTETIVSLLVPDMTRHEHDVGELNESLRQAEKRVAVQDEKLAQIMADAGFKQYLTLAATIAKGGAKLSVQHEANWQQTQAKFASQVRSWQAVQQARTQAQKALDELLVQLTALADRKWHVGNGITCAIDEVRGDTLVRRLAYQPDQPIVSGAQAQEITAHLREFGVSDDRLFWASTGAFAWRHKQGGAAGSAAGDAV